jgi:hypothetical protein
MPPLNGRSFYMLPNLWPQAVPAPNQNLTSDQRRFGASALHLYAQLSTSIRQNLDGKPEEMFIH